MFRWYDENVDASASSSMKHRSLSAFQALIFGRALVEIFGEVGDVEGHRSFDVRFDKTL